jgi:hypothetical protein
VVRNRDLGAQQGRPKNMTGEKTLINIKAVKGIVPASVLEGIWKALCERKGISRKMPKIDATVVTDREFTRLCNLFHSCKFDAFADLVEHGRILRPEETGAVCLGNKTQTRYTILLRKASRHSHLLHELDHIIDHDLQLVRKIRTYEHTKPRVKS